MIKASEYTKIIVTFFLAMVFAIAIAEFELMAARIAGEGGMLSEKYDRISCGPRSIDKSGETRDWKKDHEQPGRNDKNNNCSHQAAGSLCETVSKRKTAKIPAC